MRSVCPRSFEAEALRDGRLAGAGLAAFTRHASGCPTCAREVRALEALASGLRALPVGEADELRVLRERTRLIAAFDGSLVRDRRRWGRGLAWAAAAVVLIGALALWRSRPATPPAPAIAVRPGGDTSWSRRAAGPREIVSLTRGTLSVQVDHRAGTGRLLVELPDGELEDIGTTFSVSVEGGRTTGVAVDEGRVVLRLRGQPPVTIGARGTWRAAEPATPPVEVARPAAIAPVSPPRPPARPMRVRPAAPAAGPDPAQEFRAAVSALHGGDACAAAGAFARFVGQHPDDARAEDAAYLQVIALQRCGDEGRLKQAVEQYLRRYPQGFRRTEVERLSR
jgi:hypothetical protein